MASPPTWRGSLAIVLWDGAIGGSEVLSAALADRMRRLGSEVTAVFVAQPDPLGGRLARMGVPYTSLGWGPGRDVLRHPRRYASEVSRAGSDGALLVECGFIGAALRIGGYPAPIVGVEHGTLNLLSQAQRHRRFLRRVARHSGAWADDAEVAVSDFMLGQMRRRPHARRLLRIHNGIDPDQHPPAAADARSHDWNGLTVGFMGRLGHGKGADHLIRAFAQMRHYLDAKLLVAGDGPDRVRLASLAETLGISSEVTFLGIVDDVPGFWQRCDIAAVPAAELVEAFSMVTLEAMTCGKPIVATRNGAIPELVVDGVTGNLVAPGDVRALAAALLTYAEDEELRLAHGGAARTRAIERFHIENCARAYLDLFGELTMSSSARSVRRTGNERP